MASNGRTRGKDVRQNSAADSTSQLLARVRHGDRDALDTLLARYGPDLQRFAHRRLPQWARDLSDTPDLVQDTLVQTFRKLEDFEDRGEGALFAYLGQAVMNRIRDELRRAARALSRMPFSDHVIDDSPSPLETAIGRQAVEHYETALERLHPDDREMIVARIELGLSFAELAEATGRSSANAARMAVVRALVRLTDVYAELGYEG